MQDVCSEEPHDNPDDTERCAPESQAPLESHLEMEIGNLGWFRRGILQINRLSGSHLGFLLWRYGTALFFVAIATLSTLGVQRFFPYPFLFLFFAAVMLSAWFGGTGAGLFAVIVSTVVVGYCFVPPTYSFAINATDSTYFAAFIVCAFVASWVSSSKRKSEEALKDARDQLELRVAVRTTELQNLVAELRESERQLRLLTEVIPQQIWSAMPDGSIKYCNQRLLDYAGCAMNEIEGERFYETLHPEDRENFRQSWQTALATGDLFEGEWRVRGANGQYRLFFTRGVPLRGPEGKVLRWYGTNTDIEEHKKAEQALLRTQTELAHLSRVLTMGELTSSIAHEVNQPLTAVVTYGHACLEFLSADPANLQEARKAAERIITDGTRAGAIIGRIRALFKKEDPSREAFDINEVIRELIVFLKGEALRDRISIRTELDTDLPRVIGDRIQLQQVMLNLAMNSMDAMRPVNRKRKELLIKSRKESVGQIRVEVEDCGIGFNPEIGEKIFDPFFTTKSQGIGMGLSISRSIVESHAGRLWASQRPTGGAIFQFTVPVNS